MQKAYKRSQKAHNQTVYPYFLEAPKQENFIQKLSQLPMFFFFNLISSSKWEG